MKPVTPNFYFISETSKSWSIRSRRFKKIYRVEKFRANSLITESEVVTGKSQAEV